jgi:hypothetical protein
VTSNVVSPGPSKTGFGANMTGAARTFTRIMKATPRFGTPEKGARTLVYAITDPELEGVTGHFYYKEKELATKPVTHNTQIAAHLWQIGEEMCGLGQGAQEDAPRAVGIAGGRDSQRIARFWPAITTHEQQLEESHARHIRCHHHTTKP